MTIPYVHTLVTIPITEPMPELECGEYKESLKSKAKALEYETILERLVQCLSDSVTVCCISS